MFSEAAAIFRRALAMRTTPALREIQFSHCSFYSRGLLDAARVNIVSQWK
jgi:hypothetical protein